jgi:hypothetical protein
LNYKSLLRHRNFLVAPDRRNRKISPETLEYFSTPYGTGLTRRNSGFSNAQVVMSINVPVRPAPSPRTDVRLLDAPPVYIDFREGASIAILRVGTQSDFAGRDQRLQPSFGSIAPSLVKLCSVNIREAHSLVVANQRIAVDGNAAFAAEPGKWEQERDHK